MHKFNSDKLKKLRESRGWSLREAAARMVLAGHEKVTYQAWDNWEAGRNQPSACNIRTLAELMGVTMEDFYE